MGAAMQGLAFDDVFALLSALPLQAADLARLRTWIDGLVNSSECFALIDRTGRRHPALSALPLSTGAPLRPGQRPATMALYRLRPQLQCLDRNAAGAPAQARSLAALSAMRPRIAHRARCGTVCRRPSHHQFPLAPPLRPGAARERPLQLSAIVEADETYRLESQKGSRHLTRAPRRRGGVARRRGINGEHDCLLVARDRSGQTLDFHTGRGPVTAAQLDVCLRPVLPPDILLISDSAAAYRRFAAGAGITHEAVNLKAGIRARGAIHIQNVNAWHSRFKTWLVRFKGVASRYLVHYSGWQRVLDDRRLTTPAQLLRSIVQSGKRSRVT
jgi:hypothetical protein